jgi:hypothetical protein
MPGKTSGLLAVCGVLLFAGAAGAKAKPPPRAEVIAPINGANCSHRCASEFCHAESGHVPLACMVSCFWICGDDEMAHNTPAPAPAPPPAPAEKERESSGSPAPAAAPQPPRRPDRPDHTDVASARAIDAANPYGR